MEVPNSELPELKKKTYPSKFGPGLAFVEVLALSLSFLLTIVLLSWAFGWVAVEKYEPSELFEKYQSSRPEMRSEILMEWLRVLSKEEDNASSLPNNIQQSRFQSDLENLNFSNESDKRLSAPLISLMGYAQDKELSLKSLLEFSSKIPLHQGFESQIALIFSIARLGIWNEQVKNYFETAYNDTDPSIRKSVAYVLGSQKNWPPEELKTFLLPLLNDSVEEVKWNAALSAFSLGFEESKPKVLALLSEVWTQSFIDRMSISLYEEQLYKQLFLVLQKDPQKAYRAELAKISKNHPHVKLQRLALDALRD